MPHSEPFFCVEKARVSTKIKNVVSMALMAALAYGIYCSLRQHGHLAGGPVDMRNQAFGSMAVMALAIVFVYAGSCPAPNGPPPMHMPPPLPFPPPQQMQEHPPLRAPPPPPPGQTGRSPHYR